MAETALALEVMIPWVPPQTTAQQKRIRVGRDGRVHFFHTKGLTREATAWAQYLRPWVPPAPLAGPLALSIRFVYPYLAATPKGARGGLLPKVSRPDLDNAAKHLIDVLAAVRMIATDAGIARLALEKWHGPPASVGMTIRIEGLAP